MPVELQKAFKNFSKSPWQQKAIKIRKINQQPEKATPIFTVKYNFVILEPLWEIR